MARCEPSPPVKRKKKRWQVALWCMCLLFFLEREKKGKRASLISILQQVRNITFQMNHLWGCINLRGWISLKSSKWSKVDAAWMQSSKRKANGGEGGFFVLFWGVCVFCLNRLMNEHIKYYHINGSSPIRRFWFTSSFSSRLLCSLATRDPDCNDVSVLGFFFLFFFINPLQKPKAWPYK